MQEKNSPSKTFLGVRFVLIGFNAIDESKVRSKLVNGGGSEVGRYTQNCSHVIVDKITYDHPLCVAARKDGKTLVTGLWVDHSFDAGMTVDATSVLYGPPKDLNGIPGAERLIICLTGYQRQDREDIMAMVGLMGAQFSKPLVATRVTHLICYKFEGEKYELAKKMMRIKLVNHRWLEDCLKDWKLLPEADYDKSGYELEMMETSAKDSEDENEDPTMKHSGIHMNRSPLGLRGCIPNAADMPKMVDLEVPAVHPTSSILEDPSNSASLKDMWISPGKVNKPHQAPRIDDNKVTVQHDFYESGEVGHDLASISKSAEPFSLFAAKGTPLSYSMKTPRESPFTKSGDISINFNGPLNLNSGGSIDSSALKVKQATEKLESVNVQTPSKITEVTNEESPGILAQRRALTGSVPSSKSLKTDHIGTASLSRSSSGSYKVQELETALFDGSTDNSVWSIGRNMPHGTDLCKSRGCCAATTSPGSSKTPVIDDIPVSKNVSSETGQTEAANKNIPKKASDEPGMEKSAAVMNLDSFLGKKDKSSSEGAEKKMLIKKTLGTRNKLKGTSIQKGSIFSSKLTSNDEFTSGLSGKVEKLKDTAKQMEISAPTVYFETTQEMVKRLDSEIDGCKKIDMVDDETEASEDRDNHGFDKAVNQEKLEEADLLIEATSGDAEAKDDSKEDNLSNAVGLEEVQNETKPKKTVSSGILSHAKSRKRNSGAESLKVKKTEDPKNERAGEPKANGKNSEARKSNEKWFSPADSEHQEDSKEDKQENGHDSGGDNRSSLGRPVNKAAKSTKTATMSKKSSKMDATSTFSERALSNVKEEPKWFILKGNRSQRKGYQKIINRLKGKCCRDSHQWSYQATHFIATELRRTEKFFAAAASGRWILKSDYVMACDQAGKLLPEEPYEWHQKGLGENGAINLEAPRKWRLLREKTGHGAFYGMRIVVYGDCIVPPLGTLKRVVKAGDGTILATSPPYTRFLDSDIDFAVVSPELPRGDIWVQEFLKHKIPCVLADYLVEYVCKTGYPLDKHVLYGTQPWAERSFSKLQNLAKEGAEDSSWPADSSGRYDIACEVCGSCGRGEVMLICGDETGSTGCGIGTHIDCCDPPLCGIPDGDWLCPKCSGSMNDSNHASKKRKKTK